MDTQLQKKFNILLIGDSCIDEYYIGTCDRLSPEAPVPVIKIVDYYQTPGMAANVQENLNKLGCQMVFITNEESIVKTRYIDKRSGQHLLRVDNESEVIPWDGETGLPWDIFDAVVISDYNKGFLSAEKIQMIRTKFTGPIFLDTKKKDLALFWGCYVKINEQEYNTRWSNNDTTIVTLGERGAMYLHHEEKKVFVGNSAEVVDVCGCGDTFLAALAYQYLMTNDIELAITFANRAGSVTVQHHGNYSPSLEEINNG